MVKPRQREDYRGEHQVKTCRDKLPRSVMINDQSEKTILTHLVEVWSDICSEAPQLAKYASIIPIYTDPAKVVVHKPRRDFGDISDR